ALLQMGGPRLSEERKVGHFRKIEDAVHNMTHLLDDILALSKAESGTTTFTPKPIDLEAFCREIMEEVEATATLPHQFRLGYEGDCSHAYVDEKLLRQILSNLLTNAVKYSAENTLIHLNLRCDAERGWFEIIDEGIGIPEKDRPHLFD